jgi:hypothetical protein
MTLFGRHDKNLNDATSIYQGYDRYQTTITGGGVNSLAINNIGTIGFASATNVYLSNSTNTNLLPLTATLSTITSNISAIAVNNTGGTGWTSAPTVVINGVGTGATATATVAAGVITGIAINNQGSGYTTQPVISLYGGGNINIAANLTGNSVTSYTITNGGIISGFTSAPTIVVSGGGGFMTTTCNILNGQINFISTVAITGTNYFTSAPTVSVFGGGNPISITPTLNSLVSSVTVPVTYGSFQTQPTISYNGCGVINITATMNGGNTIVSGFTITNGGYTGCFTSAPIIVTSGAGGFALPVLGTHRACGAPGLV